LDAPSRHAWPVMPTVRDLEDALAPHLDLERYRREGDPTGVWLDSDRDVRRLGLRLEAGRPPYDWADGLDAVLVHRPFGLWPAMLPDGLGVLAAHRALDDLHSVGCNPALARSLGLEADAEPLRRDGNPIGLVGRLPSAVDLEGAVRRVEVELGGLEDAVGPEPESIEALALAGAMTESLVEDAAERGAGLYVTGQIRRNALEAVERCGVRVVSVGQGRAEWWGLRRLGALLGESFPGLVVVECG
ncbi:Nif3-like dinuclear metal center hexameric protein, partial [Rubrivirga sp.]|uniref:Nif3-like dinuclear metal center hexameric protein n=1 Tax=Rubrivirga sp. TaxID=1885344 RepID=UPI003C71D9E0